MRKAFLKRIKVTKNGKMLYRPAGQNHFNAKESKKAQGRKKAFLSFRKGFAQKMKSYKNQ